MSPRVFEILDRLESISMEETALRKELREVLETETKNESTVQVDFSKFKNATIRLLTEFLDAPNHILSYDDIRLTVMFDEDASEVAIRGVIKRARKEMRSCGCLYEIISIPKKGYKLETSKCVKTCQISQKMPQRH